MGSSNSSGRQSQTGGIERKADAKRQERVEAEEVEIHVEGEESRHQQKPPFNRQFQLRTNGCLTSLIGMVVIVVLFVIFLPLGMIILLGIAGYLGWKYRHLIKRAR